MTDFHLEIGFREDDQDFLDLVSVRVETMTKSLFLAGTMMHESCPVLNLSS